MVALLGTPAYVEAFREPLQTDEARVPITLDTSLWERAVVLGSRLLDAYAGRPGEPPVSGSEAHGPQAILLRDLPDGSGLPESFSYDPEQETLEIGGLLIGSLSATIWNFNVSGLHVLQSWIGYRLERRAGRSRSPLDHVRPSTWNQTEGLLRLIRTVEAVVGSQAEAAALIAAIVAGPTLSTTANPQPTKGAVGRKRKGNIGSTEMPSLF